MSEELTESASLELSTAGYEAILRNIHDAVYTLDETGRITWVNEVAVEEYDAGYTRDELIGAPVSKILSADDISKCVEIITELLESDNRNSGRCEIAIQTADGREIDCDLHLGLLPFENGEFRGTVGVLRDITDRKRREQGRMVLNRVLRHNVRNRVNVITGHAQLLDGQTEEPTPRVESILEAADDLIRLSDKARQVDETLTAAAGPLKARDIGSIIKDRCRDFQERYPNVSISVDAPSVIWARCDDRFAVLVDNLLENSIEHADQRSPTVEVSIKPGTAPDDMVEIRIEDDGPGIPAMEIESIVSGQETSLTHGSGLGLWLVKWLVDRYGGDLAFEERSPRGTHVIVALHPAAPPAPQ